MTDDKNKDPKKPAAPGPLGKKPVDGKAVPGPAAGMRPLDAKKPQREEDFPPDEEEEEGDEEGQRRNETVAIITQILPNAVIETANDPEEALGMMEEGDFDTFVVNFLMPGYSSSPFVKAVANHPEHPLLIGFAADKMSDAVDPKKGLKIIPLKRLFDLDTSSAGENQEAPGETPEE